MILLLGILDRTCLALPQKQIFDPRDQVMTLQQVYENVKAVEEQHARKKYEFLQHESNGEQNLSPSIKSQGRILTVPIQARSEDLAKLEKDISFEEGPSEEENIFEYDEQTWQLLDAAMIERQGKTKSNDAKEKSAQIMDIRAQDSLGIREPALITSTSIALLELSTGSKLYGEPGESVQVEFLLTNLGPDQYFTVSAKESGRSETHGDNVIFPSSGTFLEELSEYKPWVRRNETTTIIISIRVPADATLKSKTTLTLEVQPYGSTTSGKKCVSC